MGCTVRLDLTRERLLVLLANHYIIRGILGIEINGYSNVDCLLMCFVTPTHSYFFYVCLYKFVCPDYILRKVFFRRQLRSIFRFFYTIP